MFDPRSALKYSLVQKWRELNPSDQSSRPLANTEKYDTRTLRILTDAKNAVSEIYDVADFKGRIEHLKNLKDILDRANVLLKDLSGGDAQIVRLVLECVQDRERSGKLSTLSRLRTTQTELKDQLRHVAQGIVFGRDGSDRHAVLIERKGELETKLVELGEMGLELV